MTPATARTCWQALLSAGADALRSGDPEDLPQMKSLLEAGREILRAFPKQAQEFRGLDERFVMPRLAMWCAVAGVILEQRGRSR